LPGGDHDLLETDSAEGDTRVGQGDGGHGAGEGQFDEFFHGDSPFVLLKLMSLTGLLSGYRRASPCFHLTKAEASDFLSLWLCAKCIVVRQFDNNGFMGRLG